MEWIIMIVVLVGIFWITSKMGKKQEREAAQMRNSLEVGDEITTIGGIIGEIVKIKEETVTIETGKDRTKIRILRSAVRNVDVHAYEKRGDGKKPEPTVEAKPNTVPVKKNNNQPKKSAQKSKATPAVNDAPAVEENKEFNYEIIDTSKPQDKAE